MDRKVARIERIAPREGAAEEPFVTARGYRMADPAEGAVRHHVDRAVHVRTLEEAARLIGWGFCLWMTAAGKRPSLVAPKGLRILWAEGDDAIGVAQAKSTAQPSRGGNAAQAACARPW